MRMVSQSSILKLWTSSVLEPWDPSPTHTRAHAQDSIAIPAQGAGGKDTGKSSSRTLRRVIYYTLYRMDPQKTH